MQLINTLNKGIRFLLLAINMSMVVRYALLIMKKNLLLMKDLFEL